MGYKLNINAYELFIRIEVGIREFLIELIKKRGVNEWVYGFLGSNQRDTINEVSKRINEAYKAQGTPALNDIYLFKLNRARKDSEMSFVGGQLLHPFYYLNWTDMESLIKMKSNIELVDNNIGKLNREVVIKNLAMLNYLRNDIAHSRFITEDDFRIVKASFDQISVVIPRFEEYIDSQTKEDRLDNLLSKLLMYVKLIRDRDLLNILDINNAILTIEECFNSFWLNSIEGELASYIVQLKTEVIRYERIRNTPGGLLHIFKWKNDNAELLSKLINMIEHGQI